MKRLFDSVLRLVLTGLHAILKALWFIGRPNTFGAHAVALTPEGKIVLVELRYAPGWRLPGGGRNRREPPVDAALRELREEIGMVSHGQAKLVRDFDERVDFKHDIASLVVVRDVRYHPHWNWEVERICEADLAALPCRMSSISRRWIETLTPML